MNWIEFVLSDYFLLFWIVVGMLSIFLPFGLYGITKFWSWVDSEFIKPRKGYIKIRQKLGNDRWKEFWTKPEGNKIKLRTEEGVEQDIPINLGKDWIGWNGNIPFIEIDENLAQMPLTRTQIVIPKEHQTRMSYLAYLAGKIAGMSEKTRLELFLLIAIAIIVGASAFMLYTNYQAQNAIGSLQTDIRSLKDAISAINQTLPQIPKVS